MTSLFVTYPLPLGLVMPRSFRHRKNIYRLPIVHKRAVTPFPGDLSDAVVYNLEDQIGSSVTRLNTSGAVIDKEEYYPFGDSSLRTFSSKRYRYVGKEKDQESGLYYYGARYYAAWTCRFISVDPLAAKYNYWSPYVHARNNPIMFVDINGEGPDGGGGKSASLDGSGGGSNSVGQEINLEPSSTWGGDSDIKIANSHQPTLQQTDQSNNCPAKSATYTYSTEEALAFINDVRSEFKEENRNLLGKWITGEDKKTVGNNNYQPGIVKVLDEILSKNPESKINFTTKRDGLNLPENSDGAMIKTGENSYTVYWNPNADIDKIGTNPAFEEIFHLYNAITGIAEYTLQDGMWGIWDWNNLLEEEARAKHQVITNIRGISLDYEHKFEEINENGKLNRYKAIINTDYGHMKSNFMTPSDILNFISNGHGTLYNWPTFLLWETTSGNTTAYHATYMGDIFPSSIRSQGSYSSK